MGERGGGGGGGENDQNILLQAYWNKSRIRYIFRMQPSRQTVTKYKLNMKNTMPTTERESEHIINVWRGLLVEKGALVSEVELRQPCDLR